ncbi:hypothetical protein [Streptomyces salyersiae]|uniref:Uncharacterized protein n=1 Tax=Streptomyces salyersiae TaxID=3075530 RepID=A0ABU2RVU2_9ACTN|nr:hypothetical protein [Streptomyces sp. DSM 41770]MDT0432801.1 hypothetical protein [Streptomyces sp. DSM 41770]
MIDTPGGEHRQALAAPAVVVDPNGTRRPLSEVLAELTGGPAQPVTWAEITGKPATYPPTVGTTAATAATGNHTHTAQTVTATAISPGTATTVQGILAELAARITALEGAA